MPTQEILNYFRVGNEIEKLRLQIAISCAPVIKKVKVGGIIILPIKIVRMVWNSLLKSEFSVRILYQSSQKVILYIYQKEWLDSYLRKQNIQEFLKAYEYIISDTEEILLFLKKRVKMFYQQKEEFPHEIGIFLQYPLEDVTSFVENRGKNFLLSGYWKVYHNIEKAKEIFTSYDKAKEELIKEILNGKTLTQVLIGK